MRLYQLKKHVHFIIILMGCLGVLVSCSKDPVSAPSTNTLPGTSTTYIKGADVSYLPEVRQSGIACYNLLQQPEDMLYTLKGAGVNTLRLRVWHTPQTSTSTLESVKNLCEEARSMGFKIFITLHYSDTWADPSQQNKPAFWNNLHGTTLADSVYAYTLKVSQTLKPDYLQLGNEINGGMLWPDGHYDSMPYLKHLLNRAAVAVRLASPQTRIILHYAGTSYAEQFFAQMQTIDYDLIGLSYYPKWHGKSLDALKQSITTLYTNYQKPVVIAETAYPFTLGWNDWTNNVVGLESDLLADYPASAEGQKKYISAIGQLVQTTKGAAGFCYWGAEWVSYKGTNATNGSSWENQALWDFNGKALPALTAF